VILQKIANNFVQTKNLMLLDLLLLFSSEWHYGAPFAPKF